MPDNSIVTKEISEQIWNDLKQHFLPYMPYITLKYAEKKKYHKYKWWLN